MKRVHPRRPNGRNAATRLASSRLAIGCALALGGIVALVSPSSPASVAPSVAEAQIAQVRLTVGGARARAGVHSLTTGFAPDPFEIRTRPRGAIHAAELRLGAGCRGYVSAEPDVIVRVAGANPFLRFFARSGSDVTLIVGTPAGRYLCNDDVVPGRSTNPMVDVYAPRPGQYDVWIGTHEANREAEATLFVTTQREQRP